MLEQEVEDPKAGGEDKHLISEALSKRHQRHRQGRKNKLLTKNYEQQEPKINPKTSG